MGSKNQSNYEDVWIAHFQQIHLDNFRAWCDAYVCKVYQRVAPRPSPPPHLLPPIVMVIGRLRAPHTTTKVTAQLRIPERIKS